MLRYFVAGCVAGAYVLTGDQQTYLHMWGNGLYKPRLGYPNDIMNFENFTPKLIKNFSEPSSPQLTKLTIGSRFEAGIDANGQVHIWNKHIINSVQLEGVDDEERTVRKLEFPEKAVDLKFVEKILFALDAKGNVWQWRFDSEEEAKVRKIPSLSKIKKISSGNGHFVALDGEGQVWTMGDDTYGQCGLDSMSRQIIPPFLQIKYPNPLKVNLLPDRVKDVACGKFHTLALLENGEVWGWGRNHKHQLADIDDKSGKAPAGVSFVPTKINGLTGKNVVKVVAGDMFSIFITDNLGDTEVYGCGLNSRGQLGLGYLTHVTDVMKMQNISNFVYKDPKTFEIRPVGIKDLQCGAEHCMALMDVGVVYSWGSNEYGEQANKKRIIQDRPALLKRYKGKKIQAIAVGERSSAVIWKE